MMLTGFFLIVALVFVRAIYSLKNWSLNLSDAEKYENESERKISLNGSLFVESSSGLSSLIDVVCNSIFINVVVRDSVNYIAIRIMDDSGEPVYQSTINTMVQLQSMISISDWSVGKYTICFTSVCGRYLSGKFEVSG